MCTCKSAFPSQCGNNFLPFIFYVKSISTQSRSRDSKCQKFQSLKLFVIFSWKILEFIHCVTKSWKLCSIRWGVTQKLWKADVIKKRKRRKLGSCVFSLAYIVFFFFFWNNIKTTEISGFNYNPSKTSFLSLLFVWKKMHWLKKKSVPIRKL